MMQRLQLLQHGDARLVMGLEDIVERFDLERASAQLLL